MYAARSDRSKAASSTISSEPLNPWSTRSFEMYRSKAAARSPL